MIVHVRCFRSPPHEVGRVSWLLIKMEALLVYTTRHITYTVIIAELAVLILTASIKHARIIQISLGHVMSSVGHVMLLVSSCRT